MQQLLWGMKNGVLHTMDPVVLIINLLSITDQPFRILSRSAGDDESRSFVERFTKEKKRMILRSIFIQHDHLIS